MIEIIPTCNKYNPSLTSDDNPGGMPWLKTGQDGLLSTADNSAGIHFIIVLARGKDIAVLNPAAVCFIAVIIIKLAKNGL